MSVTLLLGGVRSGKSEVAEALVARQPQPVTYVATWVGGDDADMAARVAEHRSRRPDAWTTLEVGADLPAVLASLAGTALVDSLGTWVAGVDGFAVDVSGLCAALTSRRGDTVIVSEEVGLGVHPTTAVGRQFADTLGDANRRVASVCDEVLLVVAGRVLPLEART